MRLFGLFVAILPCLAGFLPVLFDSRRRALQDVMVDTGSESNWIPAGVLLELGIAPVRIERFETADGRVLDREVGYAFLYAAGRESPTIVVFAREVSAVVSARIH